MSLGEFQIQLHILYTQRISFISRGELLTWWREGCQLHELYMTMLMLSNITILIYTSVLLSYSFLSEKKYTFQLEMNFDSTLPLSLWIILFLFACSSRSLFFNGKSNWLCNVLNFVMQPACLYIIWFLCFDNMEK